MFRFNFGLYFVVIGLVFIVFITAVYFAFFRSGGPVQKIVVSPSPSVLTQREVDTQSLSLHPTTGVPAQADTEEVREAIERDSKVGALLKKLPYSTGSFSLSYNIDTNQFIAVYADGKEEQGEKELDGFLEQNGIESTSWLNNFKVNLDLY